MTAPTLPIHVDTQGVADLERLLAALKGIGPALAEVRSTNTSLGNVASVTAQLQKLRAETKSNLGELKDLLSKGLTTTYKEAEKAAEKGGDDVVAIIQKENAKIQKALTEANTVAGGATSAGRRISNSSVERPMDMALVVRQQLRDASALNLDPTTLLGLPSRDSMKSMGAQIAAQMREGIALENMRASSASGTDARSLLGLPSRDSMKSMGAQIAAQMREGIALENMRASSASGTDARSLLGLPSRDSMKSMGAQIAAQMREGVRSEALRASSASNIDVRTLLGLGAPGYSARASAEVFAEAGMLKQAKTSIEQVGTAASQNAPKLRLLTHDMNDVHSAARGLASGFGALWLTWGNLGPLLIGAALSNGFVQVIKQGAQVQNTFETIRVLSEESASSVGILNNQMLQLARTGPFGPLEIAEAMKTLSLAGLSAAEVGTAIKDVLNFSVAGNTSVKTAADVMTSVATAFRISASDYNYVGDVIAKTAAISKSSVESIGESFKTASVINVQYGASLEDVGVGLALLSNVGIQGSAAGTALRNMYADLFGRSKKAEEALKTLGVSAIDPLTGKTKDLVTIFSQLNESLGKYNPTAQTRLMADILSERGGKAGQSILQAIRKEAADAGLSVDTFLEEIKFKVDNAAGFMALSAAQMALTPLNQMKSVAASLQATLVETFDTVQPYIIEVTTRLKEIFNSEEFKAGLARMVAGVSEFTVALVKHIEVVVAAVAAYAALKVALGLAALFRGLAAEVLVAEVAMARFATSTAVAQTAAAVAGSSLGTLAVAQGAAAATGATLATVVGTGLSVLSKVIPVLTVLYGLWQLYSYWQGKSAEKAVASTSSMDALLKSIEDETSRIRELNNAKLQGITLDELQAQKNRQNAINSVNSTVDDAAKKVRDAQAAQADFLRGRTEPKEGSSAWQAFQSQKQMLGGRVLAAQTEFARVSAEAGEKLLLLEQRSAALVVEAKHQADLAKKTIADQARPPKVGDLDYTGPAKKQSGSIDMFDMSQVNKTFSNRQAALRAEVGAEAAILKAKHQAEIIDEGTYLAKVLQLNERQDREERALIEDRSRDYVIGLEKQMDKVARVKGEGSPEYMAQLEKEMQLLAQNEETRKKELAQLDAGIRKRRELAGIDNSKKIKDIHKEQLDYWAKDAIALQKSAELEQVRQKYSGYPPEYLAQRETEIATLAKHEDNLVKLNRELDEASKSADSFWKDYGDKERSAVAEASYQQQLAVIKALREELDKARGKAAGSAGTAGQQAADKIIQDRANKMRDDFADAVTTGIVDGGKAGGDALSKWLKDYFVRQPIQMAIRGFMSGGIDGLTAGLGASAWGGLTKLFGFANGAGFTSNSIVDTPTIFKFAKGVGVAGEAGPEAIMPLARDGQGRLGVRGGSGGGGNVIQLNYAPQVNVDARSDQGQVVQLVGMALKENNTKLLEHFEEMGYNV